MRGKKKLIVEKANEIIQSYTTRLTVRQIYYRLVAAHVIQNNIYQYQAVMKALRDGRLQGLIPYKSIEDRTRRFLGGSTAERYEKSGLYHLFNWNTLEDPKEHFDSAKGYFKSCWKHYRLPKWKDQPNYVEIWLEKQALAAVFEEITDKWNVRLAPCRGYPSLTFLWEGASYLKKVGPKRQIYILYFGDFDPSGLDIPRNVKERLAMDFGVSLFFRHIAITPEQIEQYNIPPMPAKHSDSRSEGFIAEYGETSAVELDALDPDVLQQLIHNSINALFDGTIADDVLAEEVALQGDMKEWIENS